MTLTIDTVGLVEDMDEATYHARSELSSTGARTLLRNAAKYQYERTHPVHKDVYDVGSALHTKVLGKGWPVDVHDFDNWTTKAAKEAKAASRAEGRVPMLRKDADVVDAMAESVLRHPLAREIFEGGGYREVSLFADDYETGVPMRARPDVMHPNRMADLKSAMSAADEDFAKAAANYGYAFQQDWYLRVRLGVIDPSTNWVAIPFLFVVVEKSPPYLVNVIELDAEFAQIGRSQVDRALRLYAECAATDTWPGFERADGQPNVVGPPAWLSYSEGMEL